ncbi:uncharacterized protein HKW66_Vig0182430 [Vigna angularis]|uniref:Uncharacterized protein n=1 Tax=Phaseolus angularis TaxID=3914 RepID=A0A8T0K589_PHAAN|nr:uncharacterized protein HKW66_Vig0182430 [Vigna angularis]
MAFSFSSCAITKPFLGVQERRLNCEVLKKNDVSALIKCSSKESSELPEKGSKLGIGSPIIFIEAPKMIKTAATMPCLRVNTGQDYLKKTQRCLGCEAQNWNLSHRWEIFQALGSG